MKWARIQLKQIRVNRYLQLIRTDLCWKDCWKDASKVLSSGTFMEYCKLLPMPVPGYAVNGCVLINFLLFTLSFFFQINISASCLTRSSYWLLQSAMITGGFKFSSTFSVSSLSSSLSSSSSSKTSSSREKSSVSAGALNVCRCYARHA